MPGKSWVGVTTSGGGSLKKVDKLKQSGSKGKKKQEGQDYMSSTNKRGRVRPRNCQKGLVT